MRQRIGVLGGTFDPIHQGHLDLAEAARDALGLDSVWLVPSHVPPHRIQPIASAFHRFAMVALAAAGQAWLVACDIELREPGPSYTGRTLERLGAAGLGAEQIFFITGADAFAEIATWRDYPALLARAQFVVVSRPGMPVGLLRDRLPDLAPRMIDVPSSAQPSAHLSILLIDAATTDVSSTEVRRRLAAGNPLEGRVPAAVEHHARRHDLYRPSAAAGAAATHLHEDH